MWQCGAFLGHLQKTRTSQSQPNPKNAHSHMHTPFHTLPDMSGLYLCVQLEAYSMCPPHPPPSAFSSSSLFDATVETQDLLMETGKRLLTTHRSCHTFQFI